MSCVQCGGNVRVNGDGDLICEGPCGETLTREELEESESLCPHSSDGGHCPTYCDYDCDQQLLSPPFIERPELWDEENWEG